MHRPILLFAILLPRIGLTWGSEGHRLVARIAEGLLTSEARAHVYATLDPGESIAALASWADEIRSVRRETEPWHYINIPIQSAGLDMMRDCAAQDCILAKIDEFGKRWHDPSVSREGRREALLFLVHFVGDLHQPLHCADNNDKGGNDVKVRFDGTMTNLHSLWDSLLLARMPEEEQLVLTLTHNLTPEQVKMWSGGKVEDWANESWRAANRTVYRNLIQKADHAAVELGPTYQEQAEPVIRTRLAQAGVRLAFILNEAAR